MNRNDFIKTYSKNEFAGLYLVHWKTIKKWVGQEHIDKLNLNSRDRTISPKKAEKLFSLIGFP